MGCLKSNTETLLFLIFGFAGFASRRLCVIAATTVTGAVACCNA
jgi:hypothetical protein